MLESLRSGDWLTPERVRIYPRILLTILTLAAIAVIAFPRTIGPKDLPLGTDFSQVWVAGKEVLAGAPAAPYDLSRHVDAQRAAFGDNTGVFGWHYPPFFLAAAALLARLPYLPALAVWQFSTLLAYVLAIAPILTGAGQRRSDAVIAVLAFPAVFVNLGHGQNGFLTAALLGAGFRLLEKHPLVSGTLFGLLAYKPQFLMILPLALLIERRWTALVAVSATILSMTGASILAFGPGAWGAFFESLPFTRLMAEHGATGFEKIQSVFAAARLLGAGVDAAYFAQGVVVIVALAALVRLLHSEADRRVSAAAVIIGMFLTTPYVLDYDMVALAPALAFLIAHGVEKGFAPFEKTVLAFACVAPLVARLIAGAFGLPVGVMAVLAVFLSTARLVGRSNSASLHAEPRSGQDA